MIPTQEELNYTRIEKAIHYLEQHAREQPALEAVADAVGMSSFHFQRMFTEWAGVSPKRFLQCLTVEHLKEVLSQVSSLEEAALAVGLGGKTSAHELFVKLEAVTPQVFKTGGKGLLIHYGFHATPFGACLLAATERGITDLQFVDEGAQAEALALLQTRWPNATLQHAPLHTELLVQHIFESMKLKPKDLQLNLLVAGTQFQVKVWEALLCIPEGQVSSYQQIAQAIGQPRALQAVGSAVGANPVGYLIPCHRVIRSTGVVGQYRWGSTRKRALLGWEMARQA